MQAVQRLPRAALVVLAIALIGPATASAQTFQLQSASSAAVIPSGGTVVTTLSGDAYLYNAAGQRVESLATGFSSARGSAVLPSGDIFVSGNAGDVNAYRIDHFNAAGGLVGVIKPADQAGFQCLGVDPDGHLTAWEHVGPDGSDAPTQGHLRTYDASGSQLSDVVLKSTDTTLDGCGRRGPDGRIYELLSDSSSLRTYDASGEPIRSQGVGGSFPESFAFGPDGSIFLLTDCANTVVALDLNGSEQTRAAVGAGNPLFCASRNGIDISPDGRLVATTQSSGTVFTGNISLPAANVSPAAVSALPGVPVGLSAAGSSVLLGSVSRYQWDLDGDGSFETDTGASPRVSHVYSQAGNLVAAVRVTAARSGAATTLAIPVAVGPVGVSVNAGAQFTNVPQVTLSVVAPPGATNVLVANDGGFDSSQTSPVSRTFGWTLSSSGPERLPKTVYVRFVGGSSGPETYQDDIILDQTPPVIESASVIPAAAARARTATTGGTIALRADDSTSGVARVRVTTSSGTVEEPYSQRVPYNGGGRVSVTAIDAAGNISAPVVATSDADQALALKPKLTAAKLGTALKAGYLLIPGCSTACTFQVKARVPRATAIRYRISKRSSRAASIVVASAVGRSRLASDRVRLRFTAVAARRLKRARSVRLALTITAKAGATAKTTERSLVLRR